MLHPSFFLSPFSHSGNKQTLVFCSSKKGTESLAKLLMLRLGTKRARGSNGQALPFQPSNNELAIQDATLRDMVSRGYAYHHAGLPPDDRAAVEESFLSGRIQILTATSTLAHGVNLPAHLVIIKGTYAWRGGSQGYENIPRSDVIQMIGRAGRPGLDTDGVAVIMTSTEQKSRYSQMSLSADVVESHLPLIFTEAVCAEISQAVITDIAGAITWLKSTFFFTRVRKNPAFYSFDHVTDESHLDSLLQDMCIRAVNDLAREKIVTFDASSLAIEPLEEAHNMTKHMIKFSTMCMLMNLKPDCNQQELLVELSKCEELSKVILKRNEKTLLNNLHKGVRFPIKKKESGPTLALVQDNAMKVYVLMLAAAQRLPIVDFALRAEQGDIVDTVLRVLTALRSLCEDRGNGCLLETAVLVERALTTRMWEVNYGSVFFQVTGLSEATRKGLATRSSVNVESLRGCSLSSVQDMLACSYNEAKQIQLFARMFEDNKLILRVGYGDQSDGDGNVIGQARNMLKIDVLLADVFATGGSASSSSSSSS